MENQLTLSFEDLVIREIVVLGRANVQSQLLVILACFVLSWFWSEWLWQRIDKRFLHTNFLSLNDERIRPSQYLGVLLHSLGFPLITLLLLHLILQLFKSQNWISGLIEATTELAILYLFYCFLLAILYAIFPVKVVKKYNYQLFGPLFALFILRKVVNLFSNLAELSRTSPFKLFGSEVTLGSIFILIVGLYFWIVFVMILEKVILRLTLQKTQAEQGKIKVSLLLIRYFLMTLGSILILGYVGVNMTTLAAVTGGLSVGIGFGLKEVVSNFISGICLLFEQALKPGDFININGENCEVKELGIRATTVRMLVDCSEKIIPNQTFFTQEITTYTGSNNLVYLSVTVRASYDSQVKEVMDLLLEVAHQHPQVLKYPAPVAFFLTFGDSSLNFELKFYLNDVSRRKWVISALNCAILEAFAKHNIIIPFPQRDINIRSQ